MSKTTISSKTMRVAHILSGDNVWGVENYVFNLMSTWESDQVAATVVCTQSGVVAQKFMNSGFEVEIVPMRGYLDAVAVIKLYKFLIAKRIDLVHVHLGLDSFIGTAAASLAKIPVVMSVHFDQPNYMNYGLSRQRLWSEVQRFKNRSIAHFLPITENVGHELMQREAVPKEKITVIHPGIPVFEVDHGQRSKVRSSLNCNDQDVVLVGVGRLESEKNFSSLLEALSQLDRAMKIKVWIIGDGSQRQPLTESIKRWQLEDRAQLLGYRADVRSFLAAADIFVLPSKAEPFGMSAVEAMIAGLPVIGTPRPGLGVIVKNEHTGLLVAPDNCSELASAITRLSQDAAMRERFGAAGRERAISLFTSDQTASAVVNVYRKVRSTLEAS